MTVSPFDSPLLAPLFGDAELAALFADEAAIASMIAVERALARAEARCGVIPAAAAAEIDRRLEAVVVPPEALAAGTASAGVPVPALVATLRARLAPEAGQWLHWGATSQDIVDTALVLRLDAALAVMGERLELLIRDLSAAALRHAETPMAGRTRSQIAAPITFGYRIARWTQPLIALGADLGALRPRIARVQFGGAVGTNAAVAPHGPAIAAALAEELALAPAPAWHSDRTALGALAGWCASLAAALAKMAGDLILMGRSESAEATAGAGGGSSTMPQKANPVASEMVVALARYAAALAAPMHLAAIHAEERDGAAWSLEWLVLPQSLLAAGACLRHAATLADTLAPDPARMRAVLDIGGGAALAEAASFALAASRPRPDAQALVKQAVMEASRGGTLAEALTRLAPGTDWTAALALDGPIAAASAAASTILAADEPAAAPPEDA